MYPSTAQGLAALVSPANVPPQPKVFPQQGYLTVMPTDPWGNAYQYTSPGNSGLPYEITSLGADGATGGDGAAADISNLQKVAGQ